jgi:hypothetical protein
MPEPLPEDETDFDETIGGLGWLFGD